MRIRMVRPEDRSEWLRMLLALYEGSAEAEHAPDVDAFLAGRPAGRPHHVTVFVAERAEGDRLAGFLELSARDYADRRGHGVGRALMQAAEGWAREHGYSELASDTLLENRASEQAHRAVGFEEVEQAIHFRKPL